jgi:hypothetical protein
MAASLLFLCPWVSGCWIQASGVRHQVPIPGSRDRGSTKNNEIEDFWFFGTSGVKYPASPQR